MLEVWKYRDGGDARRVTLAEVATPTADTLWWIQVVDATTDDLEAIAAHLQVSDLAMEDLDEGHQRSKLVAYADHWHVALHDCRLDDRTLIDNELDVIFGTGWILTVHHHDDTSLLDEMRRRYELQRFEHGTTDEGFALWAVLDVIVDRWFQVADSVDERLEAIEDTVFSTSNDGIPQDVFTLRRALVAFRRKVGPAREVLAALLRREVPVIGDPALMHLHDVNDHVLRVLDLVEGQRELLTSLLEAQLSIASNRMNQVMKATSSWGAILVLNTLIAGIYGMNFRHMPELGWTGGYPGALGLMVAVTVGGYFVFKRRGWL